MKFERTCLEPLVIFTNLLRNIQKIVNPSTPGMNLPPPEHYKLLKMARDKKVWPPLHWTMTPGLIEL
jgi:hypothetical protein